MQVYVVTAQIATDSNTPVVAYYSDDASVPSGAHPNTTMFKMPDGSKIVTQPLGLNLLPTWRDDLNFIINADAERRIVACFPDYAQRNANQFMTAATMQYGTDSTTWPQSAKDELAECNRGWDFVNSIRTASNSLQSSAPLNPCDDAHWPAAIPPINLQPY
jgi:hypothetical protein